MTPYYWDLDKDALSEFIRTRLEIPHGYGSYVNPVVVDDVERSSALRSVFVTVRMVLPNVPYLRDRPELHAK